jgi:polyribonucleotide nucleotidyltransferase
VCKVGDKMQVKVIAIDEHDRIKLSRRVLLREQAGEPAEPEPAPSSGGGGGRRSGNGGGRRRGS